MKMIGLKLCVIVAVTSLALAKTHNKVPDHPTSFPFQNASLNWDVRVDDLINRLTLDEVILQLTKGGAGESGGPAPAIERLGILPYQWNTECLRGAVEAGPATSFPQAIGLAASFNLRLLSAVARATGLEVRAKHNEFVQSGIFKDHTGLSCFAPVINIMRHPLWGRNQETYGEDPYLTSSMAAAFVAGLQGDHPRFILTNAGCKHFDAHNGPEDKPVSRLSFDAQVPVKDLWSTFLPSFESCVRAGSFSVMCSYNRLNGTPACASHKLLTDILRNTWNFTGYVVSDEGALEFMVKFHHSFASFEDAAVASVNAGCNLELSPNTNDTVYATLASAVAKGRITEDQLRGLVKPLFYTRMRLGEWDPPADNPYNLLQPSMFVQSPTHRTLSLEAAVNSLVLLKNSQLLPLSASNPVSQLAVIGPFALSMAELYGDYSADRMPEYEVPVAIGLQPLAISSKSLEVCLDGALCTKYNTDGLQELLNSSDIVVLTVGTGPNWESEGLDRWNLTLPGQQPRLVEDVLNMTSNDTNIILLIFSASPVDIKNAIENTKVKAVLWCGLPAQTVGDALFHSLTGSSWAVPAGRLPFTWYQDSADIAPITEYRMINQTYRYFPGMPLFPFGYGLSYAAFEYLYLELPIQVPRGSPIDLTFLVKNLGTFSADEVVQVYISWPTVRTAPRLQLVAFQRVPIPGGTTYQLNFSITSKQMQIWTDQGFVDFTGSVDIFVGGQQPNQWKKISSNILHGTVLII